MGVTPSSPPRSTAAAARPPAPRLPSLDRTDIPFVTIDPESRVDLDQALHIERDGDGYVVHYAIADVAAFVDAGRRGRRRGAPPRRDAVRRRLEDPAAPEGALGGRRVAAARRGPAGAALDDRGRRRRRGHRRPRRARAGAQPRQARLRRRADRPSTTAPADELLALLAEVGELRMQREAARGGVSLPLPEQEIDVTGRGWELGVPQPCSRSSVERADLAADRHGRGVADGLRARRHAAHAAAGRQPRRAAAAPHRAGRCGIDVARGAALPRLHPLARPRRSPNHAAMLVACTRLLRGAATSRFNGEPPEQPEHAALASEYAHVTAPLRRLVDRYAGEICLALCAGEEVPAWVLEQLDVAARRRCATSPTAGAPLRERGARPRRGAVLAEHVGEEFDAVVVAGRRATTPREAASWSGSPPSRPR